MRILLLLATAVLATLAPRGACRSRTADPRPFSVHLTDVDTRTCSFPVVRDWEFTNNATAFFDAVGTITALQLHQSSVGTLTGNGTSLRLNLREPIFVESPTAFPRRRSTSASSTTSEDPLVNPSSTGPVRPSSRVVGGFDGRLIARHGLRADVDLTAFCASFVS